MTLLVLWLFFSNPWHFGPFPMTPGWFAAAVLDSEACGEAVDRASSPAVCLLPDSLPGPLSQILRDSAKPTGE